ncbi:MAG: endonuclease/exonuclease/phosphatase family protein [Verrucomicrobiota bacterium]
MRNNRRPPFPPRLSAAGRAVRCFGLSAALFTAAGTAALLAAPSAKVRFATYNTSLFRPSAGALIAELNNPSGGSPNIADIHRIAEAIQRTAPDVLLVNEFDWDANGDALRLFHDNFLAAAQKPGLTPLNYPYRYTAPPNTGVSSGFDLDNAGGVVSTPGTEAYGNDCFGFGTFPGQYGLAVYSKFPIDTARLRSFQFFLWKDMPGSRLLLPTGNPSLLAYYTAAERDVLRLSSKTHLDVPIDLGGGILAHLLVSHPTPPTFDAAEDKNGKRNHDEIRLWADYIDPAKSAYIYDDKGTRGGLPPGARFVIEGDSNADPFDGDSLPGAARQFTRNPLINNTFVPVSAGGAAFGGNGQIGSSSQDTAAFSGGLRVDYVLPSAAGFSIQTGGVFWPGPSDPLRAVVSDSDPSDHHLVWLDLIPRVSLQEAVQNFQATPQPPSGAPASVVLTWQAAPGYIYQIERSPTLTTGTWVPAQVNPAIDPITFAASATVPLSLPAEGRMFYRLQISFAP